MKLIKKLWITLAAVLFISSSASAVNMVEIQNYLTAPVNIIGLPDFPPFAYYTATPRGYKFHSIFKEPLEKALEKHGVDVQYEFINKEEIDNVNLLLVKAKSGEANTFIGTYSETKMFSGLDAVYPAVISNPIHVITLEDTQEKIKSVRDLHNLRGIACKAEYFSDFVLRKFSEMNIRFVDTPFEAYKAVITGEADFMFGSMYYNRIMASRYGVGDYLKYSKNPIWNIPFFIAMSKMMPVLSEYKKVLTEEFNKPEFAEAVKQAILDTVNEEVNKNYGVVPPSFIQKMEKKKEVQVDENEEQDNEEENVSSGHIIQKQELHQKTIDEVLDGI